MVCTTSFGATAVAAQPRRALLAAALLTTFVATAVAQNGVGTTTAVLADAYAAPSAAAPAAVKSVGLEGRSELSVANVSYTNPVLAGNYPDPSVIRVGKDYWATSTSSGWAPQFPILHSRDLVNWTVAGSVFQQRPAWSDGNYWAPEISHHRGRYLVYYVARKLDGGRCVAVASARQPTGPYQDHGPPGVPEAGIHRSHGGKRRAWLALSRLETRRQCPQSSDTDSGAKINAKWVEADR